VRRHTRRAPSDIENLGLFADCSARQRRLVARLGTRIEVAAGRRLLTQGGRGSEVILILSGTAVCSVNDSIVAVFGPGEFFGEIAALDGRSRTATVTAVTDMDVVVLDQHEFEQLLAVSPDLTMRILKVAARRLRSANDLVPA
jgi:CRP/FNR family transcriptional regulator, cyclic AMP receptor protein